MIINNQGHKLQETNKSQFTNNKKQTVWKLEFGYWNLFVSLCLVS